MRKLAKQAGLPGAAALGADPHPGRKPRQRVEHIGHRQAVSGSEQVRAWVAAAT